MAELIEQENEQIETLLTTSVAEQTGVYEDNEKERNNDRKRKAATFDFEEKSPKTDFVLIVEGTKLHVAKVILTLASPVFDKMLLSEFKENSCTELKLPDKNLDDFKEFLRCIYPNSFTPVSCKNALKILPLAEEYQVIHLKIRCKMVLLDWVNSETPADELFPILREADQYDLRDLRERCVTLASEKSRDKIDAANDNCPLPAEILVDIFRQLNTRLEATNEEHALLKEYLSADMKTSKSFGLDAHLRWEVTPIILTIDLVDKSEREVVIWGVPLTVDINTHSDDMDYSVQDHTTLRVQIKYSGQNTIYSKLKVRYTLVNRQPMGATRTICKEGELSSENQEMVQDIIQMSALEDVEQGFVRDGKIGLIIQIYMSEPNVYRPWVE